MMVTVMYAQHIHLSPESPPLSENDNKEMKTGMTMTVMTGRQQGEQQGGGKGQLPHHNHHPLTRKCEVHFVVTILTWLMWTSADGMNESFFYQYKLWLVY